MKSRMITDKLSGEIEVNDELRIHEYDSLRQEILIRVQAVNNMVSSTSAIILSTWGPAFAILGYVVVNSPSIEISRALMAFQIFLLYISIILLYPLALKSGENIGQLAALSGYIKVFHEYLPYSDVKGGLYWETVNSQGNIYTHGRKREEVQTVKSIIVEHEEYKRIKSINKEYFIFGKTALMMEFFLINVIYLYNKIN